MSYRRKSALLLIVTVIALLLAGCGGGSDKSSSDKTTLTVLGWVEVAHPSLVVERLPLPADGPLAAPPALCANEPTELTRIATATMDAVANILVICKSPFGIKRP